MATSYETLVQWCNQARQILATTGKKGAAAQTFDEALERVGKALAALNQLEPTAKVVLGLAGEFDRLAQRAKALGERAKSEDPAKLREAAKSVTDELERLGTRMKEALPQVQDRQKYLRQMENGRKLKASLETYPYADTSDVDNVILGAVLGDQAFDDPKLVSSALKALEGLDKAVKLAQAKQLEGAEAAKLNIQNERKCLERQRVVMALLEQAEAGFGDGKQAKALRDVLDAAKPKLEKKDWTGALALLQAKGLPDAPALKKTDQQVLGSLPQQPLKEIHKALGELKLLVDDETYADAERSANGHIREATGYDARGAQQVLEATLFSVGSKVTAAKRYKLEIDSFVQTISGTLEHVKPRMPVDEFLVLSNDLDRLKSDVSLRRLQGAHEAGSRLQEKVASAQVAANQKWSAWGKVEKSFAEHVQTLRGHATAKGATPEARLASANLVLAAGEQRKQALLAGRDWAGLVILHDQLKKGIQDFDESVRLYAAFADARRKANEEFGAQVRSMQGAIDNTRQALSQAEGVDVNAVMAPLGERLAKAQNRWNDRLANATDEASLQLDERLAELKKLADDVVAAGLPEAVQTTATEQAAERARQAFETEAAPMPEMLRKLDHLDPVAGERFAERLNVLRSDDKTAWPEKMKLLATLIEETGQQVQAREKARPKQSSDMVRLATELKQRLQTEREKLKSSGDKTFLPLFTELEGELADLTLQAGSPNLEVVRASVKRLMAIDAQLRSIEKLSAQGSTFGPVRKALEALERDIGAARAPLKGNVPKSLAALDQLLAKLKTDVLAMSPDQALPEIAAVRQSLDAAKTDMAEVQRQRKAFVELLPVVESKIELLAQQKTVPVYVDTLRKRLEALRKQIQDPTKISGARPQLNQLQTDVEQAFLDPSKGLEMQKAVLAEAERKRLLEAQAKATLADLKKVGVTQARKAVADAGGDAAQLDELDRMVAVVEDNLKGKAPDFADALRRMKLIDQRIIEIKLDPIGPGIGSRKQLPEDARLFADAARKLVAELGAFPQQVAGAVPNLPQAVGDKLSQLVSELSRRIDPDQFMLPASQLSDSKQPIRVRRELRESALQRVRAASALLNEHPQFQALWANPIHVELKVLAVALDQRLRRLEANIRRAVH